jgi:NADH-ubiquinone oxidoreductase chain 3
MINFTNAYQEKDSVFECGFHSFLGQNRTQFSISFFIFGLLFLLFDLEILLVYPYSVSSYTNDIYGLVVMMMFFVLLTLGFIFELGKNALTIDSRQTSNIHRDLSTAHAFVSGLSGLGTSEILKSEIANLKSEIEIAEPEIEIYIPITEGDDFILVPVIIDGEDKFKSDLGKNAVKIAKSSLIENHQNYSLLAVDKAKLMFKKSEFCNCNFKV